MYARLFASAVLTAALMQGAAFAQDKSGKSTTSADATMKQSVRTLPEELEQKLKNQGFTDVKVVPGSFLVSAKDKDGDPVSMVIGPHSMTIFTAFSADSASTTGSGSNDSSKMSK